MGKKKNNLKTSIPVKNSLASTPLIKWQHIVLIIVLCVVVYSNSLKNGFVYDDMDTIVDNSLIRKTENIGLFFINPVITDSSTPGLQEGYRPLLMASFALNYKYGRLNASGYHLVNIVFHTANAVLVYLLVMIISSLAIAPNSTPEPANNRRLTALLTSLVFAAHPINSEAVNYVWQRSVLMAAFFYMAAIILFLLSVRERKTGLRFLSLASFILALMSKEIAITLPLVVMVIDWYFITGFKKNAFAANIKKLHLPYIFVASAYFLVRFLAHGAIKEFSSPGGKESVYNYFITQTRVIVKYIGLTIFPGGLSSEHYVSVSKTAADPRVWLSLAVIMLIALAAWRLRNHSRTASFFVIWFFVTLLPTSSILPLRIIMNEHRVYLPGVGLFAAVLFLIFRFTSDKVRRRVLPAIIASIIIMFSTLTRGRNNTWKDDSTLWTDVIKTNSTSSKAYNNRGIFYAGKNLHDRAIADFNRALQLNPESQRAYNNRGAAYLKMGEYDKAIADFRKTIELEPKYVGARKNMETALENKKQHEKMAELDKAINTTPNDPDVYFNRAIYRRDRGLFDEALSDFGKSIELAPDNPKTYISRGTIYGIKKLYNEAIEDFNKAIELDPGNYSAWVNRGVALWKSGLFEKAISDLTGAININPELSQAYHIRSILYGQTNRMELSARDEEKVKSLRNSKNNRHGKK